MITAGEARIYAESFLDDIQQEQLNEIEKKIVERAREGNFYFWHYKPLNKKVKETLKECSYTVEETITLNDYSVKISW